MSTTLPEPKLTIRESLVVKALASGVKESDAIKLAGWGDWAVTHPKQWLIDHPEVAATVANLREEILFDAAEALHELIRGYAGLLVQEQRLEAMLGHDIGDLYEENGTLKAIGNWPEVWRKQLVTEIESYQESERSHDGKTEDKAGGWDVTGTTKKLKRESTLAIEREIRQVKREQRDQLELIMSHKSVDAKVQAKQDVNFNVTITAQQQRVSRLERAKQRIAEAKDVTPPKS